MKKKILILLVSTIYFTSCNKTPTLLVDLRTGQSAKPNTTKKLKSTNDGTNSTNYTYDDSGRVLSIITVENSSSKTISSTSYVYDDKNRIQKTTVFQNNSYLSR